MILLIAFILMLYNRNIFKLFAIITCPFFVKKKKKHEENMYIVIFR